MSRTCSMFKVQGSTGPRHDHGRYREAAPSLERSTRVDVRNADAHPSPPQSRPLGRQAAVNRRPARHAPYFVSGHAEPANRVAGICEDTRRLTPADTATRNQKPENRNTSVRHNKASFTLNLSGFGRSIEVLRAH
jgi:hypothetical protein